MYVYFHIRTYLWITILGQDLQHRRFSALNVSNQHQFTPHHQRLRVSPFLHGVSTGPESLINARNKNKCGRTSRRKRPGARCCGSLLLWRCFSVDLIEFATAALYTGSQQPIGALHSTGFLTSLHCTHTMFSEQREREGERKGERETSYSASRGGWNKLRC